MASSAPPQATSHATPEQVTTSQVTTTQVTDPKAVTVSSIAPTATEKTVNDFFAFCGKITKLVMRRNVRQDGSHEAVVYFETEAAAKTALLLTNALIVDRAITVVPYMATEEVLVDFEDKPGEQVFSGAGLINRDFNAPDDQRSKTSVIASLLAGGYILGADVIKGAADYDEKHNISLQVKIGAEEVKKKIMEVDQQWQISATAAAIGSNIASGIQNLDNTWQISKTLQQTSQAIDDRLALGQVVGAITNTADATAKYVQQTSTNLMNQTLQQPQINSAYQFVGAVGDNVSKTFQQIEKETHQIISEHDATAAATELKPKEEGDQPTSGMLKEEPKDAKEMTHEQQEPTRTSTSSNAPSSVVHPTEPNKTQ